MTRPTYQWQPPDQGWTERDLANLPADGSRYEIIDGSLHVTPPASFGHHELADEIRAALRATRPQGWRVIREAGIRLPDGNVIPDVTVLRPGTPEDDMWALPADVALVVEVESPSSRRHDRFTKLALYAEAGIGSYWRIERGPHGPIAHLYDRADQGHYELRRSVGPDETLKVDEPFPVEVAPATWTA